MVSQSLTLMLHELATNALKYGALSTGAGLVSVGWRIEASDEEPHIVLTWSEAGGPVVTVPDRQGQGTRFISQSVRYELAGKATLDFQPEGVRATIVFPLPSEEVPNATP
jgi:two-component system CheB/CheR fusion protein